MRRGGEPHTWWGRKREGKGRWWFVEERGTERGGREASSITEMGACCIDKYGVLYSLGGVAKRDGLAVSE